MFLVCSGRMNSVSVSANVPGMDLLLLLLLLSSPSQASWGSDSWLSSTPVEFGASGLLWHRSLSQSCPCGAVTDTFIEEFV